MCFLSLYHVRQAALGRKDLCGKSGSGEVSSDVIGIFQGEMLRTLAGDRNGGDEKWLMSTYSINQDESEFSGLNR